jgi:hypothetical protein
VHAYIGQTNGYLLCEAYLGNRGGYRFFRFKCRCGTTVESIWGSGRSCGCLLPETMRKHWDKSQDAKNARLVGKVFKGRRVDAYAGKHDDGGDLYQVTCLHCQTEAVVRHGPKWWGQCRCRIRRSPEQEIRHQMATRLRASFTVALRRMGLRKSPNVGFRRFGYTGQQLVAHLESKFLPGMTWENRQEWHIDHIVPLDSVEPHADKAVMLARITELYALENLQPLWAPDNLRKGTKSMAEWREQARAEGQ